MATVHHPTSAPQLAKSASLLLAMTMTFAAGLAVSPNLHAAATDKDLERAKNAYQNGRYEAARDAYRQLLNREDVRTNRDELSYAVGAAEFQLKDYDRAVKSFSDASRSTNKELQKQALRGLGTSLYNQGDQLLAKQPETTVRAWTDSLNHFDTALDLDQDNVELKTNRDFVRQRLEDLKKQVEQQKQQQQRQDKDKKDGKGKGQGELPEEQEKGKPEEDENGKPEEPKQTDAMEEKQEGALPEGELRAGEAGKPEEQKGQAQGGDQKDENKMNEKTGFTPQEALNQLRTYANDQKSVQYLQRREQPHDGKDY